MATLCARFESVAWSLTRESIGQDLRKLYEVPTELPPKLLALVRKLAAVEGSSPRSRTLLSKLDAVEGNQLLRACRTRLRALCCLQRFGSFT